MANLAQSAVTIEDTWTEGGTNGRRYLVKAVKLVLTGQGGATNLIPASLFGMTKVWDVRAGRDSSNGLVLAAPSYDRTSIHTFDVDGAGAPVDLAATVRLTVVGR